MRHAPSRRGDLLFVYGTLRPFVNIPMARWLAARAVLVGEGRAPGRLYDLGRYPGLLAPRRCDEWVAGDLYRVTRRVLAVLDRYESGGLGRPVFERVPCKVALRCAAAGCDMAGGGRREARFAPRQRAAWLYLYRRSVRGRVRIASGDYRLYLRAASDGRPSRKPALADEPNLEPVSRQ